jgi:iron(III) transport system ATP-binding protein
MLSLLNVSKSYGAARVLDEITLQLAANTVVALTGPSAIGKTTLLRLIAGLDHPDRGAITWNGTLWADALQGLPPWRRPLSMMFQDLALWPHLTVSGHLEFVLKGARMRRAERECRAQKLLEPLGIAELSRRYPAELSGGQQQRVALARALARNGELLLLDEPFSQLDAEARRRAWQLVLDERQARGLTVIVAIHAPADIAGDVQNIWRMRGPSSVDSSPSSPRVQSKNSIPSMTPFANEEWHWA